VRLRFGPRVEADLRNIEDYIALHNPPAASAMAQRIVDRIRTLGDFPAQGRPVSRRLRALVIAGTPYLAFYRIARNEVIVLRVRHGEQLRRLP
jgi:plasmid stabilization system protein ParE